MDDKAHSNRGDLMRQLAALYAKIATGSSKPHLLELAGVERQEIVLQIVALEKRLAD